MNAINKVILDNIIIWLSYYRHNFLFGANGSFFIQTAFWAHWVQYNAQKPSSSGDFKNANLPVCPTEELVCPALSSGPDMFEAKYAHEFLWLHDWGAHLKTKNQQNIPVLSFQA